MEALLLMLIAGAGALAIFEISPDNSEESSADLLSLTEEETEDDDITRSAVLEDISL